MSVRRIITTTGSFAGGRVLTLATGLLLAKLVGPVAWGGMSTARAWYELLLTYLRGGSEQVLFRRFAGRPFEEAKNELAQLRVLTIRLSVAASVCCGVALVLFSSPGDVPWSSWIWCVLLVAAGSPLLALAQFNVSLSVACRSGRLLHAENLLLPMARFVAVAALLYVMPPLIALASGFLLAAAALFLATWTKIGEGTAGTSTSVADDLRQFHGLGINYVLAGLMSRLDIALVGMISGFAVAGPYAVVHSLAGVSSIVGSTHGRMLAPRVGKLLRNGDRARAHREVRRARRWVLLLTIPVMVSAGLAYRGLIMVLGRDYDVPGSILWPILAAYGVIAVFSYGGLLLSLDGKQSQERLSIISYAASMVVGLFVTVPSVGLKGAAATCLFSAGVLSIHRGALIAKSFPAQPRLLVGGLTLARLAGVLAPAIVAVAVSLLFALGLPALVLLLATYLLSQASVIYWLGLGAAERAWLKKRVMGVLG